MSFEINKTTRGIEVLVQAGNREKLFTESITATLELLHGSQPGALDPMGRAWPVQAAGKADGELLLNILEALLRASSESPERLLPPRWTSFDEGRATANLLVGVATASAQPLQVTDVAECEIAPSVASARIRFVKL